MCRNGHLDIKLLTARILSRANHLPPDTKGRRGLRSPDDPPPKNKTHRPTNMTEMPPSFGDSSPHTVPGAVGFQSSDKVPHHRHTNMHTIAASSASAASFIKRQFTTWPRYLRKHRRKGRHADINKILSPEVSLLSHPLPLLPFPPLSPPNPPATAHPRRGSRAGNAPRGKTTLGYSPFTIRR